MVHVDVGRLNDAGERLVRAWVVAQDPERGARALPLACARDNEERQDKLFRKDRT